MYVEAVRRYYRMPVAAALALAVSRWNPAMQKIIEFRDAASQAVRSQATQPPPSVASIAAVVDSLSRTLECIKSICATAPNGSIRDRLEIERTNLVIGLFVARVAEMRVSSSQPAPDASVSSSLQVAGRR